MNRHNFTELFASVALVLALGAPVPAAARDDFETECDGAQEVPAVFSDAECEFEAGVNGGVIEFKLSYEDLRGDVQQAHIHFAQEGVNGGITVFLCTNLGNTPPGAQDRACPPAPGTVTGTIVPADVQAVSDQGLPAGDLEALMDAMGDDLTYVNVHSTEFPPGETRGQVEED